MSVYSMPVNNELPGMLLQNMLSIKEAQLVVTRVGFVIHGYMCVDVDLCRHVASLGHNELKHGPRVSCAIAAPRHQHTKL